MSLISLLTAEPGKGKTTAALGMIRYPSAVFFVPTASNKNEGLAGLPWIFLKDIQPGHLRTLARQRQNFRVVLADTESARLEEFMGPEWAGWTFVFDDFPQLLYTKPSRTIFDHFAAGVRHREGQIIVTTQRILGVIPAFVRTVADEIYQVGPLLEITESRGLYYMGGSSQYPEFKAFYKAISSNPAYKLFPIKKTS